MDIKEYTNELTEMVNEIVSMRNRINEIWCECRNSDDCGEDTDLLESLNDISRNLKTASLFIMDMIS